MENYGYIYITENLVNGKKYIGQHIANIFEPHLYMGSGQLFKKALKKYGKENFKCDLIEWCHSKEQLNERELYWIQKYNAIEDSNFYNLFLGANGGDLASRNNVNKKVICLETGQIYESANAAERKIQGVARDHIAACCRGNQKSAFGYHWQWYEDYLISPKEIPNKTLMRNKKVKCVETGAIFDSCKVAACFLNKKCGDNIAANARGYSKSAYGYHWEYI